MATNHGVGGSNPSSPTTGQKGKAFPFRGRKIMIGIADPKLWNLGVGLLSKWNGLTFSFFNFNGGHFKYSIPSSAYFLILRPVILPQPGGGRILEQVQVLVA